MRDPELIVKEMMDLYESPEAQKDPYGAEKFRDLFMEHMEAIGYTTGETRCSVCTHVFDVRSLEEKWETSYDMAEGFKIVYICPTDNSLTPLNIQEPKGIPFSN
jgi:hypothetical protein